MSERKTIEWNLGVPYAGDPPTLSGYRQYAATMSGNDRAAKRALKEQQDKASREHFIGEKPAVVHYERLYNREQLLRDHSGGDNYLTRMKSFIADVRDNQLPGLNDPRDRKAAVWHIKSEYEQWGRERKDLHARQRAAFERKVEQSLKEQREDPWDSDGPDTQAFFAREEVVAQYGRQHEELNDRLEREITGYIESGVARQVERNRQSIARWEGATFEEIVGRPRETGRTRDKGPDRGL